MPKIKLIKAREILASGGAPSLEVSVLLDDGATGSASVSYGVSAGSKEAFVLLDGDNNRYGGQGMLKAVANVNEKIAPMLIGKDANDQRRTDELMVEADGTENKSELGANAILGVSMAVARAAANDAKLELYQYLSKILFATGWQRESLTLPKPLAVMIEGGRHADNSTDLQEYILAVTKNQPARENVRMMEEIYQALKKILKEKKLSTNAGSEGAFAPEGITNNELPLEFITEAINEAGYTAGEDAGIYIDAAASEFYKDGKYVLSKENQTITADEIIAKYTGWFKKYPILALEDGLSEFDWDNWPKLMSKSTSQGLRIEPSSRHFSRIFRGVVGLRREKPQENNEEIGQSRFLESGSARPKKRRCVSPASIKIVADDLTVTNAKLWQKAIDMKAANAILIKLNQAGTVTETMDCCLLAKKHNLTTIPSHRGGGETNDTFLVDLAVAVGSEWIKVGPTRGERVCKYNRLMKIEEILMEIGKN